MDIKGLIYEGIKILDADASSKEALDQRPNDIWIVFQIIINSYLKCQILKQYLIMKIIEIYPVLFIS